MLNICSMSRLELRGPLQVLDNSLETVLDPKSKVDDDNDLAISVFLRLIDRRSLLKEAEPKVWSFDTFFMVA